MLVRADEQEDARGQKRRWPAPGTRCTVRGDIVYMPAAISCSRIASSPTAVNRPEKIPPSHVATAAKTPRLGSLSR